MKLLSKSREDRFDSAGQAAELLEGCLAHTQRPTTRPLPASAAELLPRGGSRPPWCRFVAAGVCAFSVVFAALLIVLESNKGTLTIESHANVPIRIMQGDEVVKKLTVTRNTQSVRIAAGTYVVEVDGEFDGLAVKDGRVSLHRGSTETVTIIRQEAFDTSEGPSGQLPGATVRVPLGTNTAFFEKAMQDRWNALRWHSTLSVLVKDPPALDRRRWGTLPRLSGTLYEVASRPMSVSRRPELLLRSEP